MKFFVSGGAGFIGSAVVRRLARDGVGVVNVDALTYAGNLESVSSVASLPNYTFEHVDICDAGSVDVLFDRHAPTGVLHLAAESHVDRSIDGPDAFVRTNVLGTFNMLQAARRYYEQLSGDVRTNFRFVHVSTDEVFGSLGDEGAFNLQSRYDPHSPYSASKAGSDHLARAWFDTYRLPVVVTNCSNNYGPYQFPEKLIPLTILSALQGKPLPVYGDGSNVRDWLYVEDHVDALVAALTRGEPGETYLVGGGAEMRNIEVVRTICSILDEIAPSGSGSYERLITFVKDRPGHDFRYAIDASETTRRLGWKPKHTFEQGIRETVQWYIDNNEWCEHVQSGAYRGERLGLAGITK